MTYRKYGWKPDIPDKRDQKCTLTALEVLPPMTDKESLFPPAYDQMTLGSCTAQAISAVMQYEQEKEKPMWGFMPSRLFIYFNERVEEQTVNYDSGAMLRTGMKVINKFGASKEELWPYDISRFIYKPNKIAYENALKHRCLQYQRLDQTETALKTALAHNQPFVFGFSVYNSFESEETAKTGQAFMPLSHEKLLGGHAVVCIGYSDETRMFKIRNSWGSNWGRNGNFYMPYEYLLDPDLSCDFWIVQKMSN